ISTRGPGRLPVISSRASSIILIVLAPDSGCPSPRRPSAINDQILPRHVAAGIARQEEYGTFDFVRLTHAPHWTLGAQAFDHCGRWLILGGKNQCAGGCS